MTLCAPAVAPLTAPNALSNMDTHVHRLARVGWAWALLLALFLSGCATPRLPAPDIAADRAAENAAFWSGRMAIQVFKEPPESMGASFELQGSAQQGDMLLLSPIGTTLARLQWSPAGAKLTQGAQTIESPNLPSLASRLTGTDLPITALFDWLAGRAANVPGWQVDLSQHAQGRLSAERLSPAPRTALRIVLDR